MAKQTLEEFMARLNTSQTTFEELAEQLWEDENLGTKRIVELEKTCEERASVQWCVTYLYSVIETHEDFCKDIIAGKYTDINDVTKEAREIMEEDDGSS